MLLRFSLGALSIVLFGPTAIAGLTLKFDPDDLQVTSTGSSQTIPVDLQIAYDGLGANTVSSFTLDIANPDPQVFPRLTLSGISNGDFAWDAGPTLTQQETTGDAFLDYVVGAQNVASGNNEIPVGTSTLATVDFSLDGSVESESFPLDLTLRDANRDLFVDAAGDFSVVDSTFTVTAVPEPSSIAFLTLACVGASVRRRRAKRPVPTTP